MVAVRLGGPENAQLTKDTPPYRHSCERSQQAAEKALKAVLVLEGIDFPYTQDLAPPQLSKMGK